MNKNSGPQIISVRNIKIGGLTGESYKEVCYVNPSGEKVWVTAEEYCQAYDSPFYPSSK